MAKPWFLMDVARTFKEIIDSNEKTIPVDNT
jgi:hypothetical protein